MVNSEEFAKRLQQILEYYDLSAAAFADAIEVGRSSISHILSGRNKPSLDFVLKIVQTYPEVELYWILNGKGSFPARTTREELKKSAPTAPTVQQLFKHEPEKAPVAAQDISTTGENGKKRIRKIVIFYEDNTFEAFENGKSF